MLYLRLVYCCNDLCSVISVSRLEIIFFSFRTIFVFICQAWSARCPSLWMRSNQTPLTRARTCLSHPLSKSKYLIIVPVCLLCRDAFSCVLLYTFARWFRRWWKWFSCCTVYTHISISLQWTNMYFTNTSHQECHSWAVDASVSDPGGSHQRGGNPDRPAVDLRQEHRKDPTVTRGRTWRCHHRYRLLICPLRCLLLFGF